MAPAGQALARGGCPAGQGREVTTRSPPGPARSSAMSAPSIPVVCRTVIVVAYLAALALAGTPGRGAAWGAVALVVVWLAPLVAGHGRRRRTRSAVDPAAA